MRRIQAKKHKVGTYKIDKISLSCFDDKRFVRNDGIHTLTYFHKDLKKKIFTDNHKNGEIQKDSHKKKRCSQMIINKRRFSQIRKDSKRFS